MIKLNETIIKKWLQISVESVIAGLLLCVLLPVNGYLSFLLGALFWCLVSYHTKKHSSFKLLKAFFKKLGVFPIVGICIYALWCFILVVYIDQWSTGSKLIDSIIQPAGEPNKFIEAYAPSAFDSLVFFILVGVTLTVNSMRQPEDEKLSRKVEHIFPTVQTESKLSKHLIDKISELACINKLTERVISISDYSEKDKFIKLSIKSLSLIKNMHNNHHFSSSNLPWGFSIGECKPETEILGEVHEISIIHNLIEGAEERHILPGIVQLTKEKTFHKMPLPLELNAEKEVLYKTNAWAWEHESKKWTFNSSRYTEKRKFSISNDTGITFNLTIELTDERGHILSNKTSDTIIEPGKTKSICHEKLLPDEKISITFNKFSASNDGAVIQKEETDPLANKNEEKEVIYVE